MMNKKNTGSPLNTRVDQSGNIFFMLIGAVALIGALTVSAGNTVKGIVTSMSEVTRKTVAEEKMQAAARLAIQASSSCDVDAPSDFTEPLPFRTAGTLPHPVGGGLIPENIGAETMDPWGTEYGYCAWNLGNGNCVDSPNRLTGGNDPAGTVVAIISAGKDRRFSSTCNAGGGGGSYTPVSGVVGRWTLDETAGTLVEDSIGTNDGTYSGAVVPTGPGVVGTAFEFDGIVSNRRVGIPHDAALSLSQYTVTAWVRGNTAPSTMEDMKVLDKDWGHNYAIHWSHLTDPFSCEHHHGGASIKTPPTALTINAGQWYHIACTYDGTTLSMYVDGLLSTSIAAGAPEIYNSELSIGSESDGGSHFNGGIDDVIIFNRALTSNEVRDISTSGGGPSVVRDDNSDDIIFEYTYNDAIGLGGEELWKIIDTRPGTAGINRNIDVAGGAELTGPLNLMRSGLILPGDDVTGPCAAVTDQQLRINFSNNPAVLEICDFAGGNDWVAVSMGGSGASGPADCSGLGDAHYNDPVSGHCYYRSTGTTEWADGQAGCVADGGYLATITSATEQDVIDNNIPYDQNMWIGINEPTTEGVWHYSFGELGGTQFWSGDNTGSAVGGHYTNWGFNEPNNHNMNEACGAVMDWSNGEWHDARCDSTFYRSLCEISGSSGGGGGAPVAGAVGRWALDETTGTLVEDSIGTNDGTYSGAAVPTGPGVIGTAFEFDGTGQVDLAHNAALALSEYTITAWVRGNTAPNTLVQERVVDKDWGHNYSIAWSDPTTPFSCLHNHGTAVATPPTPLTINAGQWYHIACAYDGTTLSMYVDGALSTSIAAGAPDIVNGAMAIGSFANGGGNFNGSIDDVIIFNRGLSAGEVSTVYSGASAPEDENTVGTRTLLIHPESRQCSAAAPGPLVRVAESDNANYYRQLMLANGYIFAGGHSNGISAFSKNLNGSLTRLDTQSATNGDSARGMYYDGTYIYSANASAAHHLVAYTFDGTAFTEVASVDTPGSNLFVTGHGNIIFVSDTDAVRAYTFDGTTFTAAGEFEITGGGSASQIWSDGYHIYLAARESGVFILSFNGTAFTQIANITGMAMAIDTTGDGKYLYINEGTRLSAYTFDGETATRAGEMVVPFNGSGNNITAITADGTNVYYAENSPWGNRVGIARFNGSFFDVLSVTNIADPAQSIRTDGGNVYVGLQNGAIQIFSGAECGSSNTPLATAPSTAASPYTRKIATTETSACAIKRDGSVWCWGSGADGRLGIGSSPASQVTPARVNDNGSYTQITAGMAHVCGIRNDGTAWCWGSGADGRLGNGATANQSTPVPVSGPHRWSKLVGGTDNTCGVRSDGALYCWGALSPGTSNIPVDASSGRKWKDVAISGGTRCAVDIMDQLWCWGENNDGKLGVGEGAGNNIAMASRLVVRDPGPWLNVTATGAAASGNICGIKADGTLWCWGANDSSNTTGASGRWGAIVPTPHRVSDPGPWLEVNLPKKSDAGSACGIKYDGTMWCWGQNSGGRFGNSDDNTSNWSSPSVTRDPGPWATLRAGNNFTCGFKTDGTLWCWGNDTNGRLGNGAALTAEQYNPSRVVGFPDIAPWPWERQGLNISAGGTATTNVSLGTTGILGRTAAGLAQDCAGLGNIRFTDPATGHCYYRVNAGETWDGANRNCRQEGAYLAVITSHEEQTKIQNAFGVATPVWIDGRDQDTEGEWRWVGGEHSGEMFWLGGINGTPQGGLYSNWSPNAAPDNAGAGEHCLSMFPNATTPFWIDSACSLSRAYICEKGLGGPKGGLSFPNSQSSVLHQYYGGSELLLETATTNASAQIAWRTPDAATTRLMGISHTTGDLVIGNSNAGLTTWANAITPQLKISTDGKVGVGVTGSLYNKLEINGGLRIGNDTGNCNIMREGTLRYSGGTPPYEYCDGSAWVAF